MSYFVNGAMASAHHKDGRTGDAAHAYRRTRPKFIVHSCQMFE